MGDGVQAEAETLDQLRSLVAAQLRMEDLKAVVAPLARQEAADTLAPDPTGREAKIRAVLRASGIIDKLSEQVLGQPGAAASSLNAANVPPVPEQQDPAEQIQKDTTTALFGAPLKDGIRPKRGHRYLKVTVIRGRAFVEQPDMQEDPSCSLTVHLLLGDQRFRSTPAMGNVEPQFGFECMFELQTKDLSLLAEAARPLHTVVVRTDVAHHRSVVGTAFVDWRKALYLGTSSAAAELKDVSNPQMATGMLEMRLELFPAQLYLLSRDEVEYRIQHESKREMEASRLFFIYAKQWWGDFLQIRTSHADRLVKLFAYNELGKKLPVTSFMVPLRTRWLETPRHAARFVSLLVYEKARAVGDVGKMEIWRSAHTMLVAGRGDAHDHAILLCGLFLGFSMDAYVTLGTDKNNLAHAWVTTIDATGKVSFWETLTGIEYPQTGKHHFRTVGCCFTGDAFYANIQASDAADRTEFVLQDQAKWKSLSSDGIASMRQLGECAVAIPIERCILEDPCAQEAEMELGLRQYIAHFREDHDLATVWDDDLGHLLGQSLWTCEHQRLMGSASVAAFMDDFQTSVKRQIPEGHTFKGFPCQFNHWHTSRVFSTLAKTAQCRAILQTTGDKVRFAARARVFAYPETAASCWVMVGVRFQSA